MFICPTGYKNIVDEKNRLRLSIMMVILRQVVFGDKSVIRIRSRYLRGTADDSNNTLTLSIEYSTLILSVNREAGYKSSGHNDIKLSSDGIS